MEDILQQIRVMRELLQKIEDNNNRITKIKTRFTTLLSFTTKWAFLVLPCSAYLALSPATLVGTYSFAANKQLSSVLIAQLSLYTFITWTALLVLLVLLKFGNMINSRDEMAVLNSEINQNRSIVQAFNSSIPTNYRNLQAISAFEKYIVDGKVDSLKECVLIYDNEKYQNANIDLLRGLAKGGNKAKPKKK